MDKETFTSSYFSRYTAVYLILALYIIPVLLLSGWAQASQPGFALLGSGLLITSLGSFVFFWIFQTKTPLPQNQEIPTSASIEEEEKPELPDLTPFLEQIESQKNALEDAARSHTYLMQQHDALKEEQRASLMEIERIRLHAENQQHEYRQYKHHVDEQNDYHQMLLDEHQRTIAELRDALEKKQQHIQQLETKTRDMNYEIKTLLQLAEKPVVNVEPSVIPLHPHRTQPTLHSRWETGEPNILDFAVRTHEEAHVHLKRLLDLAQRITGTSLFSSSPRFRELPLDNYTLDLRSLFDRLKEVNASTIIVYSLKENKLLFVNDQIKELLGINPEKFIHQFQENIQLGYAEWQEAIRQLSFKNEAKTTLQLKTRTSQEINVECMLGIVPTGIFRNHIIGLLYKLSLSSSHKLQAANTA